MDETLPSELQLEDLRWLQRLARQLVNDPNEADDAVQDTLMVALTRAPGNIVALRAWLASVLRNVVRQGGRSEARRRSREQSVQTEDSTRSALEVVEELAWHRRLVEHVHALDEPYRSTIVHRFLRDQSPREISRKTGVPVKTVHTRIDRGLERLRSGLDREHGGSRHAWVVGLTPLARKKTVLGLASGAAVIPMNAKLLFLCATALGLLGALPFLAGEESPLEGGGGSPAAVREKVVLGEVVPDSSLPAKRTAIESEPPIVGVDPTDPVGPAGRLLAGRVRDLYGAAVADVPVHYEHGQGRRFEPLVPAATARTSGDGSFELLLPDGLVGPGRLTVAGPFWASVSRPYVDEVAAASGDESYLLVVAPSRTYGGRIVDANGGPIENAHVSIHVDGAFISSYRVDGEVVNLRSSVAETESDGNGRFRLEGVGFVEEARLQARRDGYEPTQLDLPMNSSADLVLILESARLADRTVHGLVRDGDGGPVADAEVAFGWDSVLTDPTGRFALPLQEWQSDGLLRVVKRGTGAVAQAYDWERDETGKSPEDPLTLYLPTAELAIRGRVLDENGRPVAGAEVWTPDTTHFGQTRFKDGETSIFGMATVEALVSGLEGPQYRTVDTRTDAHGRFELSGLLARDYAVFAMVRDTLAAVGPVRGHPEREEITLRLSTTGTGSVAGRIVSPDGSPLSGVRISLGRGLPWRAPEREVDPWSGSPMSPPQAARTIRDLATTDEDGSFRIDGVVLDRAALSFGGPVVFSPRPVMLDSVSDPEALEVVLDPRSTFRLVLANPTEADAFRLAQPDGEHQSLFVQVEEATLSTANVPLVEGSSSPAYTKAGEHTLILERDGEEVRRCLVVLPPGGVHDIEV